MTDPAGKSQVCKCVCVCVFLCRLPPLHSEFKLKVRSWISVRGNFYTFTLLGGFFQDWNCSDNTVWILILRSVQISFEVLQSQEKKNRDPMKVLKEEMKESFFLWNTTVFAKVSLRKAPTVKPHGWMAAPRCEWGNSSSSHWSPSSCGREAWAGGALRSLAVKGLLSRGWPDDCVGEGFYASC